MTSKYRHLHAFGVNHTTRYVPVGGATRNIRTLKPTREVSDLMSELKKAGVKKVGIELFYDPKIDEPKINIDPLSRYAKAVHLGAKRSGITLIPIHSSKADQAIQNLEGMTHIILMRGENRWLGWGWYRDRSKQILEQTQLPYPTETLRIINEVGKIFPNMTFDDIHRLNDAIIVSRSLSMAEKASSKNLDHIVVGGSHAANLERLYGIKTTFVGGARGGVDPTRVENAIKHYKELEKFIKRLRKVAEKQN